MRAELIEARRAPELGSERRWWEARVLYQVYPRSFQDPNGDGVGDLEGIRRRLDYFEGLGVDAVRLSPIDPDISKMHDQHADLLRHLCYKVWNRSATPPGSRSQSENRSPGRRGRTKG